MARFQSRLFNWIDSSLPAKLGRRARDWYEQIGNPVKQATTSIKKTATKAVLYPVYILASATNFRAKSKEIPLLLRPVQSLVLWIDNSKIFTVGITVENTRKSVKPRSKTAKKSRNFDLDLNKSEKSFLDESHTLSLNNSTENFNRIQKLIKDAIAYFFGKKSRNYKLKSSTKKPLRSTKNMQPWLTMADVFDDHDAVWPPLIIKSNEVRNNGLDQIKIAGSNHELTLNQSQNISNNNSKSFNKSSSKITSSDSQELISSPAKTSSRPMYAWIETQATFLGYVYNPFMQLISWLDQLIANMERFIMRIWQQLITLICTLFKLF